MRAPGYKGNSSRAFWSNAWWKRSTDFPPGDTDWTVKRSRWREIEFIFHEVSMDILPPHSLAETLGDWVKLVTTWRSPTTNGYCLS